LIGRLAVTDDVELSATATWNAYLAPKRPDPPYPADLSSANRKAWLARWRLSEAGTRFRRAQRNFGHSLKLSADHSFRVDEVQPGRYVLEVRVRGAVQGRHAEQASLNYEFGVAPIADPASRPVDLGILNLISKE
jgi:hypothetical protein